MAEYEMRNSQSSKGLLGRLLGLGKEPRPSEPLIIPRAEHNISRKNMEEEVLKVLYRLHNSGHKAYLVGGAVRDLLLERKPKDYDVATDARPDQIKKLFVNSRLIGRRFRLAHIVFRGGKVVEVSTFRRSPDLPDEEEEGELANGERDLLIREDNTWGTPQQDAYRRDFTINALFYNIADFSIIDYIGGLADLNERTIRTIGDPNIRFREDPVRMIRAIEYAARLNFEFTPELLRSIHKHRRDLKRASDARIADELLHLLGSGASEQAFRQLWNSGLLEILHPDLHSSLSTAGVDTFFKKLAIVDGWRRENRNVRDTLLLGVLFTLPLQRAVSSAEQRKGRRLSKGEYLEKLEKVMEEGRTLFRVPNRKKHHVKQAILGAYKMRRPPQKHRGLRSLTERSYFSDSIDLFTLEVETSGQYRNLLKEWQELREQTKRGGRRAERSEKQRRRTPDRDRERDRDTGRHRTDKSDRQRERERRGTRADEVEKKRKKPQERKKKPEEKSPVRESTAGVTAPSVEQAPADTPTPEQIEHGRGKRDNRSWEGVAGQQSAVIRDMKKKMEEGEMKAPVDEDIPYVVPGESKKGLPKDWEENVGRAEELAADDSKPERDKWGRSKRSSPPKL